MLLEIIEGGEALMMCSSDSCGPENCGHCVCYGASYCPNDWCPSFGICACLGALEGVIKDVA